MRVVVVLVGIEEDIWWFLKNRSFKNRYNQNSKISMNEF